jgi:hypothetical protein
MVDALDRVRRPWRGEAVALPTATGPQAVVTQPRPVSTALAAWITTAGNPETWRDAGRWRANDLTHLLGQSIAEEAEKIALYRQVRAEAGHDPAIGVVTLMLHTDLADTRAGRCGGAGGGPFLHRGVDRAAWGDASAMHALDGPDDRGQCRSAGRALALEAPDAGQRGAAGEPGRRPQAGDRGDDLVHHRFRRPRR